MSIRGARQIIHEAVTHWPGVSARPHRFGGTEYVVGARREIGHVHGDHLVDIPFTPTARDEVVSSGCAEPHHILPDSGWVSFYLREAGDVERAIALFRLSYELAMQQQANRKTASANERE